MTMTHGEAQTLIDELVVSAYGEGRARAMLSVTLDPDGQARLRRKFEQHNGAKQKARNDILAALICPPAPAAITEAMVEEGAKALLLAWQGADTEQLLNDPEWRDDYLHGSRLVIEAALKAAAQAQPGGEATNG